VAGTRADYLKVKSCVNKCLGLSLQVWVWLKQLLQEWRSCWLFTRGLPCRQFHNRSIKYGELQKGEKQALIVCLNLERRVNIVCFPSCGTQLYFWVKSRKITVKIERNFNTRKCVQFFLMTVWRVLGFRMEERPPLWREAANVLNKQSRTADKERSSRLGVGRRADNSLT